MNDRAARGDIAGCPAIVSGRVETALSRLTATALIGILPGMLLLVPGGLSFTTLSALLANDPVSGIQAGFSTLLFALSLVTGLLLSSLTSRAHEDF